MIRQTLKTRFQDLPDARMRTALDECDAASLLANEGGPIRQEQRTWNLNQLQSGGILFDSHTNAMLEEHRPAHRTQFEGKLRFVNRETGEAVCAEQALPVQITFDSLLFTHQYAEVLERNALYHEHPGFAHRASAFTFFQAVAIFFGALVYWRNVSESNWQIVSPNGEEVKA